MEKTHTRNLKTTRTLPKKVNLGLQKPKSIDINKKEKQDLHSQYVGKLYPKKEVVLPTNVNNNNETILQNLGENVRVIENIPKSQNLVKPKVNAQPLFPNSTIQDSTVKNQNRLISNTNFSVKSKKVK